MAFCTSCGERNLDTARFCRRCGGPLPAAAPGILPEERKVVTVLFCDLVGFTERSDRADPEDVKATLRLFHTLLKREIEHFGGTVDKFIGDEVFGVFGAPAGHEDDPERAVRAALRIQEGIKELNLSRPDLQLAVRIGINTGEVVVAFGSGPQIGESITGDAVNIASRLQAVAPTGGTVVGELTYEATRDLFTYRDLGPVAVKGKSEPVRVWQPLAARSRLGVGVELGERPRTPFVGREDELGLLKGAYRRTLRESSIQLVTVTGEPGVGKSRLIAELRAFIDELPEIVRYRQGRCLPYGEGITFWALGEIVKAQAGILESDVPRTAEIKLGESVDSLVDDPSERDWLQARLAPLIGLGDATETVARSETFTAWRRFLEAVAADHALVVAFEDLHWADAAMLEFLDHLLDWGSRVPMLVVCAARPELYERYPDWGGGKRNSTTLSLPPLTMPQTAMLISALLDQAVLPAETQSVLLERSSGNPLYAEEFVRMLVDREILEARAGGLRLDTQAEIPVPQTVQALIAARLDTLSPDRKSLLHDAAVMGKVFWAGSLAAMGGLEEPDVREKLHETVRKELVRPARTSSVAGQAEYSFWHLLVRDVAYAQIPRAARGARHRAAAEWIQRVAGDRIADQAELVAFHYREALELARRLGDGAEVAELERLTAPALALAGERAKRLDAGKAERYYRQALELLPPGRPERANVLVAAAEVAAIVGRFEDARRDYDEAISEYRAAGNALGRGQAMAMLARSIQKLGQGEEAESLLENAIELLERERPGPELARAYTRIAGQCLVSGRFAECLAWAEKGLGLARSLRMEDEEVRARQFRGAARCELGVTGGLEDLWSALRRGLELGLGEETAVAYGNLAHQLWLEEGPAIGRQVWSAAVEFCEVRGFLTSGAWSKLGLVEVLFDLGDWDQLLQTAEEVYAWDRDHEGTQIGALALLHRANVLVRRGNVSEAGDLKAGFLGPIRDVGHPEFVAPALVVAASIEQARGNRVETRRLMSEFRDRTGEQPSFRANHIPDALRVLIADSDLEGAAALVASAEAKATRHEHCLAAAEAILADANGEFEEAGALYAEAARRWREFGHVLEEGLALLGEGRCLRAVGATVEARERFAAARTLFTTISARPLVDESYRQLSEATALSS